MIVEFPEYTPDLPAINNPGMTLLENVVPLGNSYGSFQKLVASSTALNSYPKGFYAARDPTAGTSINFAGTATKLYRLNSGVWTDVSIAANYSLPAEEDWQFTQFGDRVIAVSIDGDMQSYQIGVSALFANLSSDSTRPYARHVDVVKDFVVVGNTYDSTDGFVPYRVRWSKPNDATVWDVSALNQTDYNDLDASDGWINGVIGGEYGVIFQERAITTMHYVGPPAIWEFKVAEINQGTTFPRAFAQIGNLIYYIGIDGFYVFDGYKSTPIGENKVDQTFFNTVNMHFRHRVTAAVDYNRRLIIWSYPDSGTNVDGQPGRMIIYNYGTSSNKKWGAVIYNHEMIVNDYTEGYSMDPADGSESNITPITTLGYWQINIQGLATPDLDQLPFSLDSQVWSGKDFQLSGFDTTYKLGQFTGDPLTARLDTPEVELNSGLRTRLLRVRPIVDGAWGTRTVQIGYRNIQSETPTYTGASTVNSTGDCPVRNNARYQRLRLNIEYEGTALNPTQTAFENAIGIEILEQRAEGKR